MEQLAIVLPCGRDRSGLAYPSVIVLHITGAVLYSTGDWAVAVVLSTTCPSPRPIPAAVGGCSLCDTFVDRSVDVWLIIAQGGTPLHTRLKSLPHDEALSPLQISYDIVCSATLRATCLLALSCPLCSGSPVCLGAVHPTGLHVSEAAAPGKSLLEP